MATVTPSPAGGQPTREGWFQPVECPHPARRLVQDTTHSGMVCVYNQCTTCGGSVRTKRPPGDISQIPQRDRELERAGNKRRQEQYEAWAAARNQTRDQAQADADAQWWDWYNNYLRSPEWRDRRTRVLTRDGGICQGCLRWPADQVHHLTYNRVGEEMLFDLVAVCAPCHNKITAGDRARRARR